MNMKHFILMCLLLFIHTSQSQIYNQSSTEGADVILICKHEGKVMWSKERDGNRLMILTAESKEETKKYSADPHNRYSVGDDLDLHIKSVSLSDSGIYYCNATPTVNLTVTASDEIRAAGSDLRHPDSTPNPDSSTRSAYSSDYEPEATASPICTPEHTTTPDSSSRTDYKSYCIKENK